jgi:hypothetical protein
VTRTLAGSAAVLLTASALLCCGASTPPPGAATVLRQATESMARKVGLGIEADFGPGIVFDGLNLMSANVMAEVPQASDSEFLLAQGSAESQFKQGALPTHLRVVTIDERVFVSRPYPGSKFRELSPDEARGLPNVAQLFDARCGLATMLHTGRNPTYVSTEQDGAGGYHDRVAATYSADQVGPLLGVKPAGDVRVTIVVNRDGGHDVSDLKLEGPLQQAGTNVYVELHIGVLNRLVEEDFPGELRSIPRPGTVPMVC